MNHRLVLLGLILGGSLFAQSRGTISGEVVDPSGASVPGAKVTVSSQAIGLVRETTSNDTGFFTVPALQAGAYEVRVEASGFKSLLRSGITLETDQMVSLKLSMEVGQLAEKVEVTAEAPLVETSNGEVARTVTQQQLQNFALPGRNPFYMLGIMPGVVSRYGNFMTDFRGGNAGAKGSEGGEGNAGKPEQAQAGGEAPAAAAAAKSESAAPAASSSASTSSSAPAAAASAGGGGSAG